MALKGHSFLRGFFDLIWDCFKHFCPLKLGLFSAMFFSNNRCFCSESPMLKSGYQVTCGFYRSCLNHLSMLLGVISFVKKKKKKRRRRRKEEEDEKKRRRRGEEEEEEEKKTRRRREEEEEKKKRRRRRRRRKEEDEKYKKKKKKKKKKTRRRRRRRREEEEEEEEEEALFKCFKNIVKILNMIFNIFLTKRF